MSCKSQLATELSALNILPSHEDTNFQTFLYKNFPTTASISDSMISLVIQQQDLKTKFEE
jgi:hypothetical protein